jgi:hypothetical protein
MTLADQITEVVKGFEGSFDLQSLYEKFPEEKKTTILW